jgi:hypothetical protein
MVSYSLILGWKLHIVSVDRAKKLVIADGSAEGVSLEFNVNTSDVVLLGNSVFLTVIGTFNCRNVFRGAIGIEGVKLFSLFKIEGRLL